VRRLSDLITGWRWRLSPDLDLTCSCCGSDRFRKDRVLWRELIDEWQLSPAEVDYINLQQGVACRECGVNLRAGALAQAIMNGFGCTRLFREFVADESFQHLAVLEINTAGQLSQYLERLPNYTFVEFPDADMQNLEFEDGAFDLVVHSDTLEHVPQPVRGLSECARVLRTGGLCAFTVPIIVDRMTRTRDGLPPSHHGTSENPKDYRVITEYGADVWKDVVLAGFRECRFSALHYPAAIALTGVK